MAVHDGSFKCNKLKELWKKGTTRGLQPQLIEKLKARLQYINEILGYPPENMLFRFHEHKGDGKGTYSINISGNWRILWETDEDEDPINIRLDDPH